MKPTSSRTAAGSSPTGMPPMVAVPESAGARVARIRMVVVLPAPLGPTKPKISPLGTAKVTPSRASWRPYRLRKPSMAIIRGPRKIADFVGWSWPHQLESRVDGACVLLLGAHPDNPSCQLARLEVDV